MAPETAAGNDDLWKAIEADQNPRQGGCSLCRWLQTRPKAEQASWARVMTSSFTTQSIYRQAIKRGYIAKSDSAVTNHRREKHQP